MRLNIKETPELKTSNLDEYIVSEETVNSGNYNDAQKVLQKCSAKGDVIAEQFYRLGNRFYNVNQKQAAELAWEKAHNLLKFRETESEGLANFLFLERLSAFSQASSAACI